MNKILETLEAEREELADWRHDFHMHPELGLEETRTAGIVAQKLRSWGIEVTEHVGVTGVVGVINGDLGPGRSIGLRCDMDALRYGCASHYGVFVAVLEVDRQGQNACLRS